MQYLVPLLVLVLVRCNQIEYPVNFLSKYGYLEMDEAGVQVLDNETVTDAIIQFQQTFNLHVDGCLNLETVKQMNSERCGVADYMPYTLHTTKRSGNRLQWDFPRASHNMIEMARKAFNIWSRYTNIDFGRSFVRTNITIQFHRKKHSNTRHNRHQPCWRDFDGPGRDLAHAEFPRKDTTHVEIDLDSSEQWCPYSNIRGEGDVSLYQVLVHEIGHTLGLMHSNDEASVMYPAYKYNNIFNTELSGDDIDGIRELYGARVPSPTDIIPSTTSMRLMDTHSPHSIPPSDAASTPSADTPTTSPSDTSNTPTILDTTSSPPPPVLTTNIPPVLTTNIPPATSSEKTRAVMMRVKQFMKDILDIQF